MKSIQTKGKSKKSEKLAKFLVRGTNRTNRPDLSSLRKPIDTSVSDLCQVSGLLEDGTDEVKSILSYECNIIYECRTCHSLFRSIVNLVSHKREYCREKFDITLHRHVLHNYNGPRESIIHMYKTEQTSNDAIKNDRILRSQVPKETNKKDLSTIIDKLNKQREESMKKQLDNENTISNTSNDQHIYLEAIDTNCSAMYQTIKSSDKVEDAMDLMKEQITELHNMTDQNDLALEEQSENQVEKSDSPIQVDMSDEENESLIYRLNNFKPINNLSCTICNAKFSTKKTLTVHVKTLHTPQRICYPCPCCTNIFANTWSVYRHLYKVHKKTNEQVRKLRPQIQEIAFHRKTTAMKGIENVRAIKVSALGNVMKNSDKTQEPINYTESNTKLCGRRGRKPKRKASLSTYLQYYQSPITAYDETIRSKRCNKLSTSTSDIPGETEDVNLVINTNIEPSHDKNTNSEHTLSPKICESSIRVQSISRLSKEDWDMLGDQHNHLSECNSMDNNNDPDTSSVTQNINNTKSMSLGENQDKFVSNKNLKLSDVVYTDTNEISSDLIFTSKIKNKKRKSSSQHNEKQLTDSKEKDMMEVESDDSKLQSSCSIPNKKTNRTLLMESKIATIANFRKLQCLLCKRKFTSMPNLRRHMAMHVDWNRYRCKLCDFKCFVKCDCVVHCNKVHNMQNDRATIAEMILKIPEDEYEDIITNETNPKKKSDSPDITDVTTSPCQPETRVENSNGFNDSGIHDTLQSSKVNSEATATSERVVESQGNAECQNVNAENSDKTTRMQDLSESVMNCGSGKLDDNPELKRMVMEVIFGPIHISANEQTDSNKPALETSDCATGPIDANDNVNSATSVVESKEAFCPILANVKQRPTRNRIRNLSEDFIYDLKERKESALISDSETSLMRKKAKLYN